MNLSTQYYQSSNKFNVPSVILFLILGLFCSVIVGCIYAVISYYSPMIIIDGLLIFGLALALSWLTNKLMKQAKSRNNNVNRIVAFFIGLVAYYSSIISFIVLLYGVPFSNWFELFFDPRLVMDIIIYEVLPSREITITGNNSSSGIGVSGIFLQIVYLIELIAFLSPIYFCIVNDYFCEKCEVWYKKYPLFSFSNEKLLTSLNTSQLGNYADSLTEVEFYKDFKGMEAFINPADKQADILNYHYCQCPNCQQNSLLNMAKMMLVKEKKRFVLKSIAKGELVKNTYIDTKTDYLLATQKDKFY